MFTKYFFAQFLNKYARNLLSRSLGLNLMVRWNFNISWYCWPITISSGTWSSSLELPKLTNKKTCYTLKNDDECLEHLDRNDAKWHCFWDTHVPLTSALHRLNVQIHLSPYTIHVPKYSNKNQNGSHILRLRQPIITGYCQL